MVKQYNRINLMENSASLNALIKMFWRTLIYRNVLNLELFIHSKKFINTAVCKINRTPLSIYIYQLLYSTEII